MAKKGDKLTDFVTSGWYNDVTRKLGLRTGPGGSPLVTQNQYITVYNHSTTPRERWRVVALGTPALDYTTPLEEGTHEELAFNTKALTSSDPHNLAILQEALPGEEGASATALLMGTSWLLVPEEHTDKDFLRIGSSNILEYANVGRIEHRYSYEYDTGSYIALVHIGSINSAPNIELRINGYDYEISYDGGDTWEVWGSGAPCSS